MKIHLLRLLVLLALLSPALVPRTAAEFRGAWVASVHNLDWPSRPGLSAAEQKAEPATKVDSKSVAAKPEAKAVAPAAKATPAAMPQSTQMISEAPALQSAARAGAFGP